MSQLFYLVQCRFCYRCPVRYLHFVSTSRVIHRPFSSDFLVSDPHYCSLQAPDQLAEPLATAQELIHILTSNHFSHTNLMKLCPMVGFLSPPPFRTVLLTLTREGPLLLFCFQFITTDPFVKCKISHSVMATASNRFQMRTLTFYTCFYILLGNDKTSL